MTLRFAFPELSYPVWRSSSLQHFWRRPKPCLLTLMKMLLFSLGDDGRGYWAIQEVVPEDRRVPRQPLDFKVKAFFPIVRFCFLLGQYDICTVFLGQKLIK